jgi:aspartate/methionine/tyrosine aminotransferase
MGQINSQAEELNNIIRETNPSIHSLLSDKGKAIFFPKAGILKQTAAAKGKKINATIGMAVEDDGTPVRLPSIASQIKLDPKDAFTYAPSYGKPELRKIWQEMIKKKNPSLKGKISLPVVTNALTHGLSISGYLFINPGDPVLVTDKFWGNYRLILENGHNGVLKTFNTFKDNGFDIESFREKLKEMGRKQIILLSFPNNPTGYTPTEEEADKIIEIVKESADRGNEIAVISDDAYFGLVYRSGVTKESLFARFADLHENVLAIKIDGATKEDYVWGFRVGFITFASKNIDDGTCEALEAKTAGAVRGNISNASHLSQSLVLQAMKAPAYWDEKKVKYELLKKRFDTAHEILEKNKDRYNEYFVPLPSNSGYFLCIELNEKLDGNKVRMILLDKYSTGVISIGKLLRIAFSSAQTDALPELFENIYKACGDSLT